MASLLPSSSNPLSSKNRRRHGGLLRAIAAGFHPSGSARDRTAYPFFRRTETAPYTVLPAHVEVPPLPERLPTPRATTTQPAARSRRPANPARQVNIAVLLMALAGAGTFWVTVERVMAAPPSGALPPGLALLGRFGVEPSHFDLAVRLAGGSQALVVLGIWLLLATAAREGRNWARIAAVLMAAVVLALLTAEGSFEQLLWTAAAAAATFLLFIGSAPERFRQGQGTWNTAEAQTGTGTPEAGQPAEEELVPAEEEQGKEQPG